MHPGEEDPPNPRAPPQALQIHGERQVWAVSERRGNDLKGVQDFCLKAKASLALSGLLVPYSLDSSTYICTVFARQRFQGRVQGPFSSDLATE